MNNRRFLKATAFSVLLSTSLFLQGCSLGIGESDFSCKNIGEGTKCTNTWDIYKMTNNGKSPSEMKKEAKEAKEGKKTVSETVDPAQGGSNDYVIDNFVTPNLPNRPVPVRTPAIVMRVWYAPYTDADGNFVVPGYSYIEIEPRKWTLGVHNQGQTVANTHVFEPLKTQTKTATK